MGDDEHRGIELWFRYLRETRAAADPWEKRAMEYHKAALEFSKMIVTNLYVLNAGGLVGLPALSAFLNISVLPKAERLFVLGVSATGFGLGLLFAAMCSLSTYYNYQTHQLASMNEGERAEFDVGVALGLTGKTEPERAQQVTDFDAATSRHARNAKRTFVLGHMFGWLSILSFTGSAVWLGLNFR